MYLYHASQSFLSWQKQISYNSLDIPLFFCYKIWKDFWKKLFYSIIHWILLISLMAILGSTSKIKWIKSSSNPTLFMLTPSLPSPPPHSSFIKNPHKISKMQKFLPQTKYPPLLQTNCLPKTKFNSKRI
jgi:hypothetical protein